MVREARKRQRHGLRGDRSRGGERGGGGGMKKKIKIRNFLVDCSYIICSVARKNNDCPWIFFFGLVFYS